MKGKFLLYSQLGLIVLLFYFGNFSKIFSTGLLSILFALGAILGLYAFYNLGLDTYTPFAEPRREGKHVQTGAYQFIRHPMYTAVMVIGLTLLFSNPNFTSAIIFLLLIYVLDQKATIEEEFLTKLHPTYKAYAQNTKKFIPYLY